LNYPEKGNIASSPTQVGGRLQRRCQSTKRVCDMNGFFSI